MPRETEAREKLCPLLAVVSGVNDEGAGLCKGNDCALWVDDGVGAGGSERLGHCGLVRA